MMICPLSDPRFTQMIDDHKTGHYGEDSFSDRLICRSCGAVITEGDEYYDIDGDIYCTGCRDEADRAIAESVRGEYTFEL